MVDNHCVLMKREARKELRRWRRGEGDKSEYIRKRKNIEKR